MTFEPVASYSIQLKNTCPGLVQNPGRLSIPLALQGIYGVDQVGQPLGDEANYGLVK